MHTVPALASCARLLAPAGLAAAAIACGTAQEAASSRPGVVETADGPVVTRGDFERELLLTGELQAVRSVSIKSPQTAIFQMRIQFMAEEGAVVRAGEPILSFDSSALVAQVVDLETRILDAETQIVAKRSELSSALKDLEIEIAEKLYENDRTKLEASVDPEVLSRKEHGERQLAYETAAKRLEEARQREELTKQRGQAELDVLIINRDKLQKDLLSARHGLDLLTIEAPSAGLVIYEKREGTTLRYQEGDSCWPGQGIITLPDLSEMQVLFAVNEVDAPLVHVGMPVTITVDAFPGRQLKGEIRQVPSMAVKRSEESKIAIFKVVAALSETWVGEMKPGMSVQGRAIIETAQAAPLVARERVMFDGERYWVEGRPGDDGERWEIHPLARNASFYLISEADSARLAGGSAAEEGM